MTHHIETILANLPRPDGKDDELYYNMLIEWARSSSTEVPKDLMTAPFIRSEHSRADRIRLTRRWDYVHTARGIESIKTGAVPSGDWMTARLLASYQNHARPEYVNSFDKC